MAENRDEGSPERTLADATVLAQAGYGVDPTTGAVVPPLHTATTFGRDSDNELVGGYLYSRYANPTVVHAERLLAGLEGGADAMLFASGLAAVAAVYETVPGGGRVVAPTVMYHGAQDWLRRIAERRGIGLTLFDATDPDGLGEALRAGETTLVWIESPVNPTWDVIDIRAAADQAHAAGAVLAVDSTVASPMTTRGLDLGADLVFHSATKYLNGHSDVLAGALITPEVNEIWEELQLIRRLSGGGLGARDAWMLIRGMRTLPLRFERSSKSALQIAQALEEHPSVDSVLYPGLESHPGHEVARRQMTNGFGGMLSILVKGGAKEALALTGRLHVFVRATSLGGVQSLAEHRASVEGPHSVVPTNLVRLSIGIEDPADLIADLEQALAGD
jgi:cystathionine gamma-synthase